MSHRPRTSSSAPEPSNKKKRRDSPPISIELDSDGEIVTDKPYVDREDFDIGADHHDDIPVADSDFEEDSGEYLLQIRLACPFPYMGIRLQLLRTPHSAQSSLRRDPAAEGCVGNASPSCNSC